MKELWLPAEPKTSLVFILHPLVPSRIGFPEIVCLGTRKCNVLRDVGI